MDSHDHHNMHKNMTGHMDHTNHMDHNMMGHDGMNHSSVTGSVHDMMDHAAMGHNEGVQSHDMMMMQMWFYFGVEVTILFEQWHVTTVGGLIGSMIGILIFAISYEGIKYAREHLFRNAIKEMTVCAGNDRNNFANNSSPIQFMERVIYPPRMTMCSQSHFIQTLLHMLQFIMSYFLMLIFMTYNGWLCIACVVGAGLGYFLFGWRKSVVVDITEHCH